MKTGSQTNLDRALDALEHSQAHDGPRSQQRAGDVRVKGANLINGVCNIQSVPVPEVGSGRAVCTFLHWVRGERNDTVMIQSPG